MGMRAAIYARVSSSDQFCERQVAELTALAERGGYDVMKVYKETASDASANRAARNQVLDLAQARQIDAENACQITSGRCYFVGHRSNAECRRTCMSLTETRINSLRCKQ